MKQMKYFTAAVCNMSLKTFLSFHIFQIIQRTAFLRIFRNTTDSVSFTRY